MLTVLAFTGDSFGGTEPAACAADTARCQDAGGGLSSRTLRHSVRHPVEEEWRLFVLVSINTHSEEHR